MIKILSTAQVEIILFIQQVAMTLFMEEQGTIPLQQEVEIT